MNENQAKSKFDQLREQAEEIVGEIDESQKTGMQRLIQELEVYQIELEMQNEELRKTQQQLREAHNKYQNLFEFAPIGYFTVDKNGIIEELNLTGAELLGLERKYLVKRRFTHYIAQDYQDVFYLHRKRLFETEEKQICELQIVRKDNTKFWARLESEVVKDNEGKSSRFRTAVTDITEQKEVDDRLKKYRNELEKMVNERTTELAEVNKHLVSEIEEHKKAKEEILSYQERLRAMTSELSLTEERERQHIAAYLHDDVGQSLAICQIMLGEILKSEPSTESVRDIKQIRETLEEIIEKTRSLTFDLSSPNLYKFGLELAVKEMLKDYQEEHDILFSFKGDKQSKQISEELRITLFKAVRELIVNIIKHAQATKVKVSILKEGDNIKVCVEDNGVGAEMSKFDFNSDENSGFGLFNVRERLDYLGGYIEIESEPGDGTCITLVAPLES